MRRRVVAIIINDNKILLLRRIKDGKEYFVFPGGGVEEGEAIEQAVIREIKEETNLDISLDRKLWEYENEKGGRLEHYFLVTKFTGKLQLGGPEKERMNEQNQYFIEWKKLSEISDLSNLYPEQAKQKVIDFFMK